MSIVRFGLLAVGIGAAMVVVALIAGAAFFFQHHQSERRMVKIPTIHPKASGRICE
jgi:CRISPR/Cas system-associated protein Csm6